MTRFDQILSWIENVTVALTLGAASVIAILQVIMRYVFDQIYFWSEEAVIYLVIYSTFVGASIALRHNQHVNINVVSFLVKERGKLVITILAASVTSIYCLTIGGYAWMMVTEPAAHQSVTPALRWELWVVQLAIPIGLTLMFIRSLEILYRTSRRRPPFPEFEEANHDEYGE